MRSERLPFDEDAAVHRTDDQARIHAVDPARNVVLEASAGTGKTRVLVDRYVNLLRVGVDPANILAITFTRKAAAEMRARILTALKERAAQSATDEELWRATRDRAAEIGISTIDAFCLSLLREFPLEADLDPGFAMADENEVPRLMEAALNRAMRLSRGLAQFDDRVKLVFAQLGEARLREGLESLLERRLVAEPALERALETGPEDLTAEDACANALQRLRELFTGFSSGLETFLESGPIRHPRYALVAADMQLLCGRDSETAPAPGVARAVLDRIGNHFLVRGRKPRTKFNAYSAGDCVSAVAWQHHLEEMRKLAPGVADVLSGLRRDLNAVLSRGVWRIYRVAMSEYGRTLDAHAALDFPELLARALTLLGQMDEFSRSRYRLESRYHHLLVDEFQDTSRAQWELVALLIRSWAEGVGLADGAPLPPSIFLVGDRKQSIYGFRDADPAVIESAATFVDALRPEGAARRAIFRSFRAVAPLLAFTNDLFEAVDREHARPDAFRYDEEDRFPIPADSDSAVGTLGIAAGATVAECANQVAAEIERLIGSEAHVRDPSTCQLRAIRPADIAILFRSRDSHRGFEAALELRRIPTYVYKGLGFFEADEVKDVVALLRYLAVPTSHARAAALLRSRLIRLSDPALQRLAPHLADALSSVSPPAAAAALDEGDRRVLARARSSLGRWLGLVDRLPPADLVAQALSETAYLYELRGSRVLQARENLKKIRALIRRMQNRGYATLGRIAEHLDRLSGGDESNAVIDAVDAVSLMTVHAAKGLEFPVVFLVNLTRGTGGRRPPIRVGLDPANEASWVSVGDYQSAIDQDAKVREREETKRLLYVAVTRARDRLYLVSEVKDRGWKPAPGSLGEVLPGSFKPVFEAASLANAPQDTAWRGRQGRVHWFRVCASAGPMAREIVARPAPVGRTSGDDFERLGDVPAIWRSSVTASIAEVRTAAISAPRGAATIDPDQALLGTLVHRLFEHSGAVSTDAGDIKSTIERLRLLVREEELVQVDDLEALLRDAGQEYLALCAQLALSSQPRDAERWFEVPFSVRPAGSDAVLRGTFDCLVRSADGRLTVLEFKTGSPSEIHRKQLAVYLAAARALFPGSIVEGKLVYARFPGVDLGSFDA